MTRRKKPITNNKAFSILCYIVIIMTVFYPWIVVGNAKYNIIQLRKKLDSVGIDGMVKQSGMTVENPGFVGFAIKVQMVFYFLFLLICLGYILSVVIGKHWRLNFAAFYGAVALIVINSTGYSIASLCTNDVQAMLFPAIPAVVVLVELLASRLLSQKSVKKKNN